MAILTFALHNFFLAQLGDYHSYPEDAMNGIANKVYRLRESLNELPASKLKEVITAYSEVIAPGFKIKILSYKCSHAFENCSVNQLFDYLKQHKMLLTHKYYQNANLWVEFAFCPPKNTTMILVWLGVLTEILFILIFSYLIAFKILQQVTNYLSSTNNDCSRKKRKAPLQIRWLYQKIDGLITDKILILSTLFHDLKAPITRASLKLQLKHNINSVEDDLNEIQGLVDATMNYYKNKKLNTDCDISTVFTKIKQLYVDAVEIKNNRSIVIPGNEWLLFRALVNLVSNAIRYAKGCIIDYKLKRADNILCISIQDYGSGLSQNEIIKIFKQKENYANKSYKGCGHGVGLAICMKIIKLHGGKMHAFRNEIGLEIIINLPLKVIDDE
ncbi:sensor histidine kinase [Facilibium subflavum]|uniref:sensor histidine kinase n=1 Tax=Facilibium subflavum TaxID=2219058 RepID=UPI0013C33D1E|nr:sensor histidine kinase [Facilibium subflavum]